jgi:hypothetical protein
MDLPGSHSYVIQERFSDQPLVAAWVVWRHASFVSPEHVDIRPRDEIGKRRAG